ncbi:hypothetical protein [Malaciobacter canalis]
MSKTVYILIILALFFSIRYFIENSQEKETMTYQEIQSDLDNIKNSQ